MLSIYHKRFLYTRNPAIVNIMAHDLPPALITHDGSSHNCPWPPWPWVLFRPTLPPSPSSSFFSFTYRTINTIASTRKRINNIPRRNRTLEGLRVSVTRLLEDEPPCCNSNFEVLIFAGICTKKACIYYTATVQQSYTQLLSLMSWLVWRKVQISTGDVSWVQVVCRALKCLRVSWVK
jgi:hypothetical protein